MKVRLARDSARTDGSTSGPSLLVAASPGDGGVAPGLVAVGDAQARPVAKRLDALLLANGWDIADGRTEDSLNIVNVKAESVPMSGLRRSNSDSQLYIEHPTLYMASGLDAEAKHSVEERTPFADASSRSSDAITADSDDEDIIPSGATDSDDEFIIGGQDVKTKSVWRRSSEDGSWCQSDAFPAAEIRLSDFQALPPGIGGEKLSFGSLGHVNGESCKVCVFLRKKNKNKNSVMCRHGALCFFCHAEHKPYVRLRPPGAPTRGSRYGRINK